VYIDEKEEGEGKCGKEGKRKTYGKGRMKGEGQRS
jgi:hypothetical protein